MDWIEPALHLTNILANASLPNTTDTIPSDSPIVVAVKIPKANFNHTIKYPLGPLPWKEMYSPELVTNEVIYKGVSR